MGIKKINRDMLIEKATYFFRTQGFSGTSMQAIADALKINKASLYHHVKGKENLGLIVLKTVHHFFKTHILCVAYEDTLSVKERLKTFAQRLEAHFMTDERGGCVMATLALEVGQTIPAFAHVIQTYLDDWTQALAHLLEMSYSPEHAHSLAAQAVAQCQGALIEQRLGRTDLLLQQKDNLLALLKSDYSSGKQVVNLNGQDVSTV